MKKFKKEGFTLIELIAVLVIMAIIALIVTPLVMSIIRKARVSADKRSIDAYGRSIELAIAGYLMDTGSFPTSIGDLAIEYSGDEVVCTTTQINTDSSVYLSGCTVGGRSVEGYTYGKEVPAPTPSYSVGDHVSYNGVTYYVIEDSDTTNDTVKLLKEEPLTKTEMDSLNLTGITISESKGYGQVQYGSSTDYSTSTVKQVVDVWKNSAVKSGDTATARLITKEELENNFEFEEIIIDCGGCGEIIKKNAITTSWMYNSSYVYWIMSTNNYDESEPFTINSDGTLDHPIIASYITEAVRPLLELNKSADITKLAS